MLSHSFIYICTFSFEVWMYGPEIIIYMVLKYMEMSSSDWIPIHENWCLLTLSVVRFSEGYLWLGNINVYINHTFWFILLSCFCIRISHLVCLICRSQIRPALTNDYTTMK